MPQAPLYAYLSFDEGEFRLCVSSYKLPPWGSRVIKGRSPPAVIERYIVAGHAEELALDALKAASRYFDGKEFGHDPPVFGEPIEKRTRKKDRA